MTVLCVLPLKYDVEKQQHTCWDGVNDAWDDVLWPAPDGLCPPLHHGGDPRSTVPAAGAHVRLKVPQLRHRHLHEDSHPEQPAISFGQPLSFGDKVIFLSFCNPFFNLSSSLDFLMGSSIRNQT